MDYDLMNEQLAALTENVPYPIANLANAASLLYQTLPGINWAGFYLLQGKKLTLGPFMGKPACVEIPLGKGVCGTAAAEGRTVTVTDVHAFPGHIACDCASNSEIVVPLFVNGALYGVLDIDSPLIGRFTEFDREKLEAFARILCAAVEKDKSIKVKK
ncbi:MAG: GAF domain-containing protein [Clostridia bacterium]|nr:GAF domain-containing protein [Clostridia bacterium]